MLDLENLKFKDQNNFFLIAGTCVVESEEICLKVAEKLITICQKLQIPLIYKGSFQKANRSRTDSFVGIGNEKALKILQKIGKTFDVPTLTDIHESHQAQIAAQYVDVLQIPAFLCRQTDLLEAAAKTHKYVNIKKGQFLAPESMQFAIEKVRNAGNPNIIATDRGTQFGYGDIVVDYRGIPQMQTFGVPVVMDCTHPLQQPNQPSGITGGKPQLIETIARAAIAVGADGIFIETHPNPQQALSDGANMLDLALMEQLLEHLVKIRATINAF